MQIEPDYQKVYNSKWFQEQFIDENGGDPGLYLTRLLNFNYNSLSTDFDGTHYDILLKCPTVLYTKIDDVITVDISPFKFIMDSTYFEFNTSNTLTINYSSIQIPQSYPLSILTVIKYKYTHDNVDQKAELKVYLYDSLRGLIFPNDWDHNSHYIFLSMKHVYYNELENDYEFLNYTQLSIPPCINEGYSNGSCDLLEPIDFSHTHTFTHAHEYYEPHTHDNIIVTLADLGGINISENGLTYLLDESGNYITDEFGQKLVINAESRVCSFSLLDSNQNPIQDVHGNNIVLQINHDDLDGIIKEDVNGYYIEDANYNRYYILNDLYTLLGTTIEIPFIDSENQLPSCANFLDLTAIGDGKLIINGIEYKYDYNYCLYAEYLKYFIFMMNDILMQYYVRNIPVPNQIDLLYNNYRNFFGEHS